MDGNKRKGVLGSVLMTLASVSALGLGGEAWGQSTVEAGAVVQGDLAAELNALKARIAELEQKQHAQTVAVMQDDAARRSEVGGGEKLLAGWGVGGVGGPVLMSADGNYTLQFWGLFQFRSVTNWSGMDNLGGLFDEESSVVSGYEIRRLRLGIKGHVISPELTYVVSAAFNRSGGSFDLDSAYVQYMFRPEWGIKFGQFKESVFREETVSSSRQLAAERSMLNEILGGGLTDWVQGVALVYEGDRVHGEFAMHDGADSDNTNFTDISSDYGFGGRVDVRLQGDWKGINDFTAIGNKEPLLVMGAGFDYTAVGDVKSLLHTVDVQYETATGLNLYAAYLGRHRDLGAGSDYDYGFMVQGGQIVHERWEPFARYAILYQDNTIGSENYFQEVTMGVNYYFLKHNAKVTVDVVILPDGSPRAVSGAGIQSGVDEQIVLRGQFQLSF